MRKRKPHDKNAFSGMVDGLPVIDSKGTVKKARYCVGFKYKNRGFDDGWIMVSTEAGLLYLMGPDEFETILDKKSALRLLDVLTTVVNNMDEAALLDMSLHQDAPFECPF